MTRPTLTSAIMAVELARGIVSGSTEKPRSPSQREKMVTDLQAALEYLWELHAYHGRKVE